MYSIAIDGPAGAGKSTIAKILAKRLGYVYVDTGAMYRAMGLYFIRRNIAAKDQDEIESAAERIEVEILYKEGSQRVLLFGEDVTETIRGEEVGKMASAISVYGKVREKLLNLQREIAAEHNVVMDGRDIGTEVLPQADTKIFLTADVSKRAERRYKELIEKGVQAKKRKVEEDIRERDERDSGRKHAPLKKAKDAYLLDSTNMSIEEVVEKIIELSNKGKSG